MVAECGVKPAASSLRLKITKKVQFEETMEDQITAGENERQVDCSRSVTQIAANNIGSYKVE